MDATHRIERTLAAAVASGEGRGGPPRLAAAIRHAVFPGGARIRPQLCLAVAQACGDDDPALADAAAAAIELLHCASLVHDDLPCFDDAADAPRPPVGALRLRRAPGGAGRRRADRAGLPDAGAIARSAAPQRAGAAARRTSAAGVGMPLGIVAGQAWECEPRVGAARLPARQDRRAVRRGHRGRRRGRRRRRRRPGARSASASARPTRWPTTSAT